jgi:hypothetical protein
MAHQVADSPECPHCPDGHRDPLTRPWAVYVTTVLDGDGQPNSLIVGPTNCAHVAESDAEWLRDLIRNAKRAAPAPEVRPTISGVCTCSRCETGEHRVYYMIGTCGNCHTEALMIYRVGDRADPLVCPVCGCREVRPDRRATDDETPGG